jgi:tetratricopeptide (TPR) repeat protein
LNSRTFSSATKADAALVTEAIGEARAALAVDPRSALALNALALAQFTHVFMGTAADRDTAWQEGLDAATRSIEADRDEGAGYMCKGLLLAYARGRDRIDEALTSLRRAHEINPHSMPTLTSLGFVEIMAGHAEPAIDHLQQALRISPRDPIQFSMHLQLSSAYLCIGQYADGVASALLGIREAPRLASLHAHLAANLVGLGELDKAKAALEEARRVGPGFVERGLAGGFVYHRPEHLRRATTFLRIAAGLEDPGAAEVLR